MKKFLIFATTLFTILIIAIACQRFTEKITGKADELQAICAADGYATEYYWYRGEKIPLTLNKSYVNIIANEISTRSQSEPVKLKLKTAPATRTEYSQMVRSLKLDGQIERVLPFYERGNSARPIGTSDVFM